ncbi:MAG: cation-translocating P-type ATPase [Microgenomates group bacterium]
MKNPEEIHNGLQEEEAQKRLRVYGLNEVKGKEIGAKEVFLRQFRSPFFHLLFIAAIISFLIGEAISGGVILFFVGINLVLGFFQEYRAEKAASLLKNFIPSKTKVLREGVIKIIEKKFLVPGDLVLLEAGDIVPADLKVLEAVNLLVDEAILTGESSPVGKKNGDTLFAGTSIVNGETKGIVIATGSKTSFGKIAKLSLKVTAESLYEKELLEFCRLILRIVVVTIVFVFLANLILRGTTNFFYFLIFSVALIVTVIPEALPTVVSFALGGGALKLAGQNVVVKRLSAVEDLGNIQVLCTDKTGTLTENRMKLAEIYSLDKEKCLLYGLLSSDYLKEKPKFVKNSFDSALYAFASEKILKMMGKYQLVAEIPFDPFRTRNSVLVKQGKKRFLIVKGAPEMILGRCKKFKEKKETAERAFRTQGNLGRRVLAVGWKEFSGKSYQEKDESNLNFLGFFSFEDPLKPTAQPAISLAKKLGVKVKILTGDSKEVAFAVGKKIGLVKKPSEVVEGKNLEALLGPDFTKACENYAVFARVSPEMKHKIIKTLGENYEVGFLGEGINDAPALKTAQVGIAVEGAADISKEAADIILLRKDLKVIIEGIRVGRNIFTNIQKYIKCTLASNFGNFYSIALISLFVSFLPMLPIQILLVNLLTDFPLISIATDSVDAEELKRPKVYRLKDAVGLIVLLGGVSAIFDFLFFAIFRKNPPALIQTLWFLESILTEIVLIFSVRTRRPFWKARRPAIFLLGLALASILLTVILPFSRFGKEVFFFVSPPISSFLIVLGLVLSYFIISEGVKLKYFYGKIAEV